MQVLLNCNGHFLDLDRLHKKVANNNLITLACVFALVDCTIANYKMTSNAVPTWPQLDISPCYYQLF